MQKKTFSVVEDFKIRVIKALVDLMLQIYILISIKFRL